jgi:hypothetical protein
MSQPASRLTFTFDDYLEWDGQWWVDSVSPGERLHLESIDFECLLEKIHEDLSEPLGVGPLAPERLPV